MRKSLALRIVFNLVLLVTTIIFISGGLLTKFFKSILIKSGLSELLISSIIQQTALFLTLILVVLIIALITTIYFQIKKSIIIPINSLQKSTKLVAAGNLKHKVELDSNDEFSELAASFNLMTDKLSETLVSKEELQQALDYTKTLLEQIPVGMLVIGMDKKIRRVNEAALKMLGLASESEAIGEICHRFFSPSHVCPVIEMEDDMHNSERFLLAKDGRKVQILKTVRKVKLGGEDVLLETFVDITERKKSEEEKERLKAQLLQSDKMVALGHLAGGIAHDFNNLLTAIQGFTECVSSELKKDDPLQEDLHEVLQAVRKAASLTGQLLIISRKQPTQLQTIDLNTVINDLMNMLSRIIGEDIKIEALLADKLNSILSDESKLTQIIMNLVVNAKDAMPNGGSVYITTANKRIENEDLPNIPDAVAGDYVMLSIEDDGIGMSSDVVSHIFEPFFTTKNPGQGTGMGLALVYGIVKQNGGWISIYSIPGKGSIFNVYFPVHNTEVKEAAVIQSSEKYCDGEGKRILLIEDDKAVREFASKVLTKYGFTVIQAATKQEALDVFKREKHNFDLIFTDSVLPDGSGVDTAEYLKAIVPSVPVLITSGYVDHKSNLDTIQRKRYAFLQKPYLIAELMGMITRLMEPPLSKDKA